MKIYAIDGGKRETGYLNRKYQELELATSKGDMGLVQLSIISRNFCCGTDDC